jgi:hypothetical protein
MLTYMLTHADSETAAAEAVEDETGSSGLTSPAALAGHAGMHTSACSIRRLAFVRV